MELFESIGLKADPFTTSPNPDLFFPAKEHKQCLEGLELAIRMRRGLSVVRGGIGTGKTTISRKLIQNFSSEDDVKFEFYPVLDPKFESELVITKTNMNAKLMLCSCEALVSHDGSIVVCNKQFGKNKIFEFFNVIHIDCKSTSHFMSAPLN